MGRRRAPHAAAGGATDVASRGWPAVLVVDDEPVVRAFIGRALEIAGIPSSVVASGREALRVVADGAFRPTVLLTDIDMPGMTGIELAARVAALRPQMRIVMMTGDPAQAEAARLHPTLVSSVLLKPVTIEELINAVRVEPLGDPKAPR